MKLTNENSPDWFDLTYLQKGTPRQQKAYQAIQLSKVFSHLKPYSPVLAGTIPLGIDTETSDLDILYCTNNLNALSKQVYSLYQHYDEFSIRHQSIREQQVVVTNFYFSGFEFEIFAQNTASHSQHAYRHMVQEYRLLRLFGNPLRELVYQLKRQGVKTEPAFAQCLQLKGDPYLALLEMEKIPNKEIMNTYKELLKQ
ncbi:DUF4269 domain-containing protein [Rapidithrix thailandica]|uniref:DUF4269 domain-containing protein n=1 Tax=Rapidithrix thailandica TaxID=413964 RepID=A0AAW9RXG9_9BACT